MNRGKIFAFKQSIINTSSIKKICEVKKTEAILKKNKIEHMTSFLFSFLKDIEKELKILTIKSVSQDCVNKDKEGCERYQILKFSYEKFAFGANKRIFEETKKENVNTKTVVIINRRENVKNQKILSELTNNSSIIIKSGIRFLTKTKCNVVEIIFEENVFYITINKKTGETNQVITMLENYIKLKSELNDVTRVYQNMTQTVKNCESIIEEKKVIIRRLKAALETESKLGVISISKKLKIN